MKLRPFQSEAVDAVIAEWGTHRSTLGVAATGLGKTRIIAGLMQHQSRPRGRMMFLAHREELIFQAAKHIHRATGLETDIEMADLRAGHHFGRVTPVVVSTIQTQVAGNGYCRMERFDPSEFGILVIDEAHHAAADSYRRVIDYYSQNPNLKVIGVTATPDRADERALGQIFESVAFDYDIRYGIDEGWLVPIRQNMVNVEGLDFSGMRVTAGDLNGADLARVMEFETVLHGIASPTLELTGNRRTLIFAASVVQAERLCEILNRHKPDSARFVYAKTPKDERRAMFSEYHTGRFQYLCNVGVATEGFDEPGVEVVVMGRATMSRSLYAQMIGRGTRPLAHVVAGVVEPEARRAAIETSAKPYCEVLDFVGNCGKHKLITTADILGGTYDDAVIERAEKAVREQAAAGAGAQDMQLALELAAKQLREEAEAERRKLLVPTAKYRTHSISPFDVFQITPWRERAWDHDKPASEKMLNLLDKWKIPTKGLNFTQARQLITECIKRSRTKRCTFKQAKLLARYGYSTDVGFAEASQIIDALAKNGWKTIPAEVEIEV